MGIQLTFEQAERIALDYQYLVGRKFLIKDKILTVNYIRMEELEVKDYFTVYVIFDDINTIVFRNKIDDFCNDVNEPFDVNIYL